LKKAEAWQGQLDTERSALERQTAAGWVVPTGVELVGDKLVWNPHAARRLVTGKDRFLEEFLHLRNASDAQVLRYAQKWGTLGNENDSVYQFPPCSGFDWADDLETPSEPVEGWRFLARKCNAALVIAARLHQRQLGVEADWQILGAGQQDAAWEIDKPPKTIAAQWDQLCFFLNGLTLASGLLPRIGMVRAQPTVVLSANSLLGAISHQLMLAASKAGAFAHCSECGNAYAPTRRPRIDQRHYCGECQRRGVVNRNAQRAWRSRR
jgi:hypothetical protein